VFAYSGERLVHDVLAGRQTMNAACFSCTNSDDTRFVLAVVACARVQRCDVFRHHQLYFIPVRSWAKRGECSPPLKPNSITLAGSKLV